jgi:hypothetical protein
MVSTADELLLMLVKSLSQIRQRHAHYFKLAHYFKWVVESRDFEHVVESTYTATHTSNHTAAHTAIQTANRAQTTCAHTEPRVTTVRSRSRLESFLDFDLLGSTRYC